MIMTPPKYMPIEKAALLTADPARFMQLYRSGAIACRVIDGIPCVSRPWSPSKRGRASNETQNKKR